MRPSTQSSMADPPSLCVLLRRFSNLEEAWRQVRSHAIRSQSPEIRDEARLFEKSATAKLRSVQSRLVRGSFKFEPARGIAIRRKGKTPRPVVVAPIESRIVQRALLNVLQDIPAIKSELQAGYNYGGVSGSGFGVPAAIAKALRAIRSSGYYIRTDIKSFFIAAPRATALDAILSHVDDPGFAAIFRRATEVELKDVEKLGQDVALFPLHETGVAQGSALSPLLCNYLLRGFDKQMNGRGIVCIRYIDDFILFAKDKRQAFQAFRSAEDALKALGLEAYDPNNPAEKDKADHGRTNRMLGFLGCEVSLTCVRPQRAKWSSLLTSTKEIFDQCIEALDKLAEAGLLPDGRGTYAGAISAASNIVRGWGNTYSFCNDDRLMRNIDKQIDQRLVSFRARFDGRISSLDVYDRRRALGLFLLADCNKDLSADSARTLASEPPHAKL